MSSESFKVCGVCAEEIHIDSDSDYCFACRLRDVISGQNYLSSPEACENACKKACFGIKAVFTCGHYQCRLTTMSINRCINCGCNEPNEQLDKETYDFLVKCGIIAETLKCENACSKNCYDLKAIYTCGHYQCRLTRMHINWCIRCGCNEPNEQLKKETHDFLVECGIIEEN